MKYIYFQSLAEIETYIKCNCELFLNDVLHYSIKVSYTAWLSVYSLINGRAHCVPNIVLQNINTIKYYTHPKPKEKLYIPVQVDLIMISFQCNIFLINLPMNLIPCDILKRKTGIIFRVRNKMLLEQHKCILSQDVFKNNQILADRIQVRCYLSN